MWSKLKQFFHREDGIGEDPYPDLNVKIMNLLGKELSPLFNQIREKYYHASFSLPYIGEYDHPFGLYRHAIDTTYKALIKESNKRYTVTYLGQKKENTYYRLPG